MTQTVPLPKPKPVDPELRDSLVPDFDPGALLVVLFDHLPFLLFIVVIAIVIHLTRKLVTRRRSILSPSPDPSNRAHMKAWPSTQRTDTL